MTQEAARLLYAGIVGDTGRFLYPATTATTLRLATELLDYGLMHRRSIDEWIGLCCWRRLSGLCLRKHRDRWDWCWPMIANCSSVFGISGFRKPQQSFSLPGKSTKWCNWAIFVEHFQKAITGCGCVRKIQWSMRSPNAIMAADIPLPVEQMQRQRRRVAVIYQEIKQRSKNFKQNKHFLKHICQ